MPVTVDSEHVCDSDRLPLISTVIFSCWNTPVAENKVDDDLNNIWEIKPILNEIKVAANH